MYASVEIGERRPSGWSTAMTTIALGIPWSSNNCGNSEAATFVLRMEAVSFASKLGNGIHQAPRLSG